MEFEVPYIPTLSVNRYKIVGKGGRKTSATRPEVKEWMEGVSVVVKSLAVERFGNEFGSFVVPMDLLPITVRLSGQFKDNRVPDLDNLAKVTLDAIADGLIINDRDLRFKAEGYTVGWSVPKLIVKIEI